MTEWFESWFDTKYYHLLYKDRNEDEARAFISNLIRDLNVSHDSKILDLCCGKGRHSKFLNSKGYSVVGADLSNQSIQSAKKFENENLKFLVHDMRDKLPGYEFDLVVNLFTSFGYFKEEAENEKVIQSIYSYLKANGVLIIDFLNVNKAVKNLIPHQERTIEGILFNIDKKVEEGMIKKSITFTDAEEEFSYEENVRILNFTYFEEMLTKNGFEIIETFGDYDLSRFDKEDSDRLIIKAVKK
ncbi:MAG: class I SAM-dependent methyltransferase [Crocinitomicaceae bacterium]